MLTEISRCVPVVAQVGKVSLSSLNMARDANICRKVNMQCLHEQDHADITSPPVLFTCLIMSLKHAARTETSDRSLTFIINCV